MIRRAGLATLAVVLAASAAPASADVNDLVMSRLTARFDDGRIVPQNAELRALASQLGVVLAPHLLTPADTIGFGGFQLSLDYATTTIDRSADYWRVLQGTPEDSLTTVGVFARKGFWLPLPSFEFGVGAVHLAESRTWTGQLYTKFALHEGYTQLPLPSVAVRGGVSRMMTQRELDLTIASFDVLLSKHFGIGDTWRLDPFAGWNLLMIIPRSEVIDPTPHIDPLDPASTMDAGNSFVFTEQDTILRHRLLVGVKLQFYVVQLTLEASFALAGKSVDDQPGTSAPCALASAETVACDATDTAKGQRTLSLSAGVDF